VLFFNNPLIYNLSTEQFISISSLNSNVLLFIFMINSFVESSFAFFKLLINSSLLFTVIVVVFTIFRNEFHTIIYIIKRNILLNLFNKKCKTI